ncbi:uncharacterized protein VTP21DRAFT_9240 [Calcarisporiella thermophila]|uniref:uncharacterized protein n=1 Tax=Calcarisporiella thermophila TaxID=911321 RepID=UPI003743E3C3
MEEINEYERARLENIRQNQELLRELELKSIIPKYERQKTPKINKKPPKKSKEPTTPVRQSLRLRGIQADSEAAKRKHEQDAQAEAEVEQKRARKEGILSLNDAADSDEEDNSARFARLLEELSRTSGKSVDEMRKNLSRGTEELRKEMGDLKISDDIPMVTSERIYCAAFHPSPDKWLAVAGDKVGTLGFWDVHAINEGEKTFTYKPHTRTISSMAFSPSDSTKLYTASYDSSVRCLDMVKQVFTEAYIGEDSTLYSSIDLDPTGNLVYFSDNDGRLSLRDLRSPMSSTMTYQLHEKKIGCINVNSLQPHLLVTSSLDRTMRLWDLRGGSNKDEGPLEIGQFEHGKSVTSAYFSPNGQRIVSTSYDDRIRVFSGFTAPDYKLDDRVRISHNNQTGRWLTMFRARWSTNPISSERPYFCVGNMKRYIDIFDGTTGDLLVSLNGGLTAVPAVNTFHPATDKVVVLGANASGRMCVFS